MNIQLIQGDITQLSVDVIVNSANSSLMGGGGVDGTIHTQAGPELKEECKKIREDDYPDGLPTGQAVITGGYDLQADYVIHTVGPKYSEQEDRDHLLKNSFENSLKLAEKNKLESIVFPAISSGAYGYPTEEVAEIAIEVVQQFNFEVLEEVIFCLYSQQDYDIWKQVFNN